MPVVWYTFYMDDQTLSNDINQSTDINSDSFVENQQSMSETEMLTAEMESRSQEELLAQELSSIKGTTPESVGMTYEPVMLATVRTYESLGMPDPETLAMNAIYEGLDKNLSDQEKKARIDTMKLEYDNWKSSQK